MRRSVICCLQDNIITIIKSKERRWKRHVASMRKMRNAYKIFVGIPEGKRWLGTPRRRCEDNIAVVWTVTYENFVFLR
jgi:hypothetical protein